MSEITIIYILLAMAFLCIIWLLLDLIRVRLILYKAFDNAEKLHKKKDDRLNKHDKEIGEILVKFNYYQEKDKRRIPERVEEIETSLKAIELVLEGHLKSIDDQENDICDLLNRIEAIEYGYYR